MPFRRGGFALTPDTTARTLPVIPAGVPATVLARRPDVAAAQASLLAAQALHGMFALLWRGAGVHRRESAAVLLQQIPLPGAVGRIR